MDDDTTRPRTRSPRGRLFRPLIATVVAVGAALFVALAIGVGVGALTDRPALFLTTGLCAATVTGALVGRLILRHRPDRLRRRGTAIAAAVAAVAVAAVLLLPLRDARPPDPPPGTASWQLSTGSRLSYLKLPGTPPRQPAPIVVLHGGPGIPDPAGEAAVFGRLTRQGYDVYLYAQLGAGGSSRLGDPTGYTLDRDVADLEAIRRVIGADRLVLIGHSHGGALAAHYLADHPDQVEKLVLSSPGPLDPADTSTDRATAGLDAGQRMRTYLPALAPRALLGYALLQVNPVAAHAYLGDAEADARNDTILTAAEPGLHCPGAPGHGAVHGSGFYALQYPQSAAAPSVRTDVRPALTGLPTPTLVLKGSCDYLSWRSALDYRRALPNTVLAYLPGAGHNTYQDRPEEVVAATEAFLAGRPLPLDAVLDDSVPPGYTGPP